MIYAGLKLLLGVSSSIAAYRALDVASTIIKGGGSVRAVLTGNAGKLVSPAAFDAICGRPTITSLWDSGHAGEMDHLAATKWANCMAVAPATANTLARLATGLADDALSTLAIAWPHPMVIAPAMNPTMFQHVTVQENLARLRERGHRIVGPAQGPTACGDLGIGRLADVADILIAVVDLYRDQLAAPNLAGKTVLVTSGPTREFADPVRCITNPSTGKMGAALARAAADCGARVVLVTGPTETAVPENVAEAVHVTTAEQMRDAVLDRLAAVDAAIFAAAVSDWRPAEVSGEKEKKEAGAGERTLRLVRTPDIAAEANARRRPGQVFVGFAAESHDLVPNAQDKLARKGFDLVVANSIIEPGSGFGSETNRAVLVTRDRVEELPQLGKLELAHRILARVADHVAAGG